MTHSCQYVACTSVSCLNRRTVQPADTWAYLDDGHHNNFAAVMQITTTKSHVEVQQGLPGLQNSGENNSKRPTADAEGEVAHLL